MSPFYHRVTALWEVGFLLHTIFLNLTIYMLACFSKQLVRRDFSLRARLLFSFSWFPLESVLKSIFAKLAHLTLI
jgi:hypothetical protein